VPESWLDADAPASSGEFVRSLHRGFVIIRAFGPGREELTLSEVAAAAGLSRPVARRYLLTLAELGYVRAARHRFALRRKVLELGYSYLSGLALTEIAAPHMADLVARLGYTCSLAVLDGADMAYVGAVPARRIMGARASVGALFPASQTSMGRVLLAYQPGAWLADYLAGADAGLGPVLAQVRADGFVFMDDELEPGLRAMAVPVRTRTCGAAAALNVSASMSQVTAAELRRDVLPELRAAALRIAGELAAGSVVQA
jgi:IclR family transcriptional regulator, pca regulon regulatory protein